MEKGHEQNIITVEELAEMLGVHRITVYRHLKESGLPGFKVGRIWRFQRDEVFNWISHQQTKKAD
jgi:excisionase family DNA binding protein